MDWTIFWDHFKGGKHTISTEGGVGDYYAGMRGKW